MKIIDLVQGRPEWHAWRRTGIGASDIGPIMGVCSYRTANDVYQSLTGNDKGFTNHWMERGNKYEPEARELYEKTFLVKIPAMCIEADENAIFHASLDGYDAATQELIEIKVPSPQNYQDLKAGHVTSTGYLYQLQWQMLVSGAPTGKLLFYSPEEKDFILFTFVADAALAEKMKKAVLDFWQQFLNLIPPEKPNGHIALEYSEHMGMQEVEEEILRLMDKKEALEKEMKPVKELIDHFKKNLANFGDDGSFTTPFLSMTRSNGRTKYDYKKMKEDGIDILKYRVDPKSIGFYILTKRKLK